MIILATILGPILAVQAQKAVESWRARRANKLWVFQSLMATRAVRLTPDHVRALNMIDLAFYGTRIIGIPHRTRSEQAVIDAWHEYLDHLGNKVEDSGLPIWNTQGDELFVNMLFAMSKDLRFAFDRVQLKKGGYVPIAHGDMEFEQNTIRRLALKLLSGQTAMKMEVTSFPTDDETVKSQLELQQKLSAALEGSGALHVVAKKPNQESPNT